MFTFESELLVTIFGGLIQVPSGCCNSLKEINCNSLKDLSWLIGRDEMSMELRKLGNLEVVVKLYSTNLNERCFFVFILLQLNELDFRVLITKSKNPR